MKVSYDPQAYVPVEDVSTDSLGLQLPECKSIAARGACLLWLAGRRMPVQTDTCTDVEVITRALADADAGREIWLGESGTALRFLTALLSSRPGEWVLTGSEWLMNRPMQGLLDALRSLGANPVEKVSPTRWRIRGKELTPASPIAVEGSVSSQWVSALLLAGIQMRAPLTLKVTGREVSAKYTRLTVKMMRRFGIPVSHLGDTLTVQPTLPKIPFEFAIERDCTSASYFMEFAAITRKKIFLPGADLSCSIQPDAVASRYFGPLGLAFFNFRPGLGLDPFGPIPRALTVEMGGNPDLVPSVVCACAALGVPFRISGVAHLEYKESHRLTELKALLSQLGIDMHISQEDGGSIRTVGSPAPVPGSRVLCDSDDHRMVMAASLLACSPAGVQIEVSDPHAVDKSFPQFWKQMRKIGITLS